MLSIYHVIFRFIELVITAFINFNGWIGDHLPHFSLGRMTIPQGYLIEAENGLKIARHLRCTLLCWRSISISISVRGGLKLEIEINELELVFQTSSICDDTAQARTTRTEETVPRPVMAPMDTASSSTAAHADFKNSKVYKLLSFISNGLNLKLKNPKIELNSPDFEDNAYLTMDAFEVHCGLGSMQAGISWKDLSLIIEHEEYQRSIMAVHDFSLAASVVSGDTLEANLRFGSVAVEVNNAETSVLLSLFHRVTGAGNLSEYVPSSLSSFLSTSSSVPIAAPAVRRRRLSRPSSQRDSDDTSSGLSVPAASTESELPFVQIARSNLSISIEKFSILIVGDDSNRGAIMTKSSMLNFSRVQEVGKIATSVYASIGALRTCNNLPPASSTNSEYIDVLFRENFTDVDNSTVFNTTYSHEKQDGHASTQSLILSAQPIMLDFSLPCLIVLLINIAETSTLAAACGGMKSKSNLMRDALPNQQPIWTAFDISTSALKLSLDMNPLIASVLEFTSQDIIANISELTGERLLNLNVGLAAVRRISRGQSKALVLGRGLKMAINLPDAIVIPNVSPPSVLTWSAWEDWLERQQCLTNTCNLDNINIEFDDASIEAISILSLTFSTVFRARKMASQFKFFDAIDYMQSLNWLFHIKDINLSFEYCGLKLEFTEALGIKINTLSCANGLVSSTKIQMISPTPSGLICKYINSTSSHEILKVKFSNEPSKEFLCHLHTYPSVLYQSTLIPRGMAYLTQVTKVVGLELFFWLEPSFIKQIVLERHNLDKRSDNWNSWIISRLPYPPPILLAHSARPELALSQPSTVTLITLNSFRLKLSNEEKVNSFLLSRELKVDVIAFCSTCSQISGSVSGIELVDLSSVESMHRHFLRSVKRHSGMIDFHFTSKQGFHSLLEVNAHCVRVMYLQRYVLLLIGYIRDFVIPSFRVGIAPQTIVTPVLPPGMFRYCINFINSEVHLPVNSKATDSACIIFDRLSVYKSCPLFHDIDPRYCYGPWAVTGEFISAFDLAEKVLTTASPQTWILPIIIDQILKSPTEDLRGASILELRVSLLKATLCSWCNSNSMGTIPKIEAVIDMIGTFAPADGCYANVYKSLGMKMMPSTNKTLVKVNVNFPTADLLLAKGQYAAIVNFIQQNFTEPDPEVLPVIWPLPTNFEVLVADNVYCNPDLLRYKGGDCRLEAVDKNIIRRGSSPLSKLAAIFSDVVVVIEKGRIVLIDNEPEYYNLLADPLGKMIFSNKYEVLAVLTSDNFLDKLEDSFPSRDHLDNIRLNLETQDSGLPLVELVFENLKLNFHRRHNGGGQGIDVDVETMFIHELKFANDNQGGRGASPGRGQFAPVPIFSPRQNAGTGVKQLMYRQHDVGNLRKCEIFLANSSIVVNLPVILSVVNYFLETITLNYLRFSGLMNSLGMPTLDFKRALDVEVSASNFCICLPEVNEMDGLRAVCFVVDAYYGHCWRGLMQAGPGKVTLQVKVDVLQVFIADAENIKESFSTSLTNQFRIFVVKYYNVIASDDTFENNLGILQAKGTIGPSLSLSSSVLDLARGKTTEFVQYIDVNVEPMALREDEKEFRDEDCQSSSVHLKMSIKDISFISKVITYMKTSLRRRMIPTSIEKQFPMLLISFDDIAHLPLPTFYHRHVPVTSVVESRSQETNIKPFVLEITIHNNTYNVDILKASLSLRQLHHNIYKEGNHAAFGFILDSSVLNDDVGEWEPFVENMDVTLVSSVNEAKSSKTDLQQLLRYDIYALPVDLSISHTGLTCAIKKFLYSDVVTTSSQNLPPYKISNKLGVPIIVSMYLGQELMKDIILQANEVVPIDMDTLKRLKASKSQRTKSLKYQSGVALSSLNYELSTGEEHRLGIQVELHGETFQSLQAISIDREGSYPLEMAFSESRNSATSNSRLMRAKSFRMGTDGSNKKRDNSKIPCLCADIMMRSDGGRDIVFNPIYSIKNDTSRPFEVKLSLKGGNSAEYLIDTNHEIFIPLHLTHPLTSIKMRFDRLAEWKETVSSLAFFIHNGDWGAPKRLRALLCVCPPPESSLIRGIAPLPDVKSQNWLALLKPESRFEDKKCIPIRFPAFDDNFPPVEENVEFRTIPKHIPIRFTFSALVQICNTICQPFIYRFADSDGNIISEGSLLCGQSVNVHKLYSAIFQSNIYVSIRILNYCWSPWALAFTLKHPFKIKEKNNELVLQSMNLSFHGKAINLPSLTVIMAVEENYIIFSAPMVISNRTGLQLDFREPSESNMFIPHTSQVSALSLLKASLSPTNTAKKKKSSSSNLDFDPASILMHTEKELVYEGDSDDENDSESDEDSEQSSGAAPSSPTTDSRTLFIHMPTDHFHRVDIVASSADTLSHVFDQLKHKMQYVKSFKKSDFHFFVWENGRLDVKKVTPPPTASEDSRFELGDGDLPPSIAFGLFVDCSVTPLSMDTTIGSLKSLRLRLCHVSEWNIFLQTCSMEKQVIPNRRASGMSMFGVFKSKVTYEYKTSFSSFDGDIPFNPPRLMGVYPNFSLRVQQNSDWSDSIDPLSPVFSLGGSGYISVKESVPSLQFSEGVEESVERFYDLGLSLQKGTGLLKNVVSVTIVPRFILISKLPINLRIRQKNVEDEMSEGYLTAGSAIAFHFTRADRPRLLEARRYGKDSSTRDDDEITCSDSVHELDCLDWFGEMNICNLGIIYLKLCRPLQIIKVNIEIVGASIIATLSEQSTLWPPYRVDNFTTLNVRFRQSVPMGLSELPWTEVSGLNSVGYAWDRPESGEKYVTIEFFQGTDWVGRPIMLDDLARTETVSFFRNLPDLERNSAEGYLEKYDPLLDVWNQVYCVIVADLLYMFKDETRKLLMGIINLSRPQEKHIQLAKISKHEKPTWDIVENIETTMGLLGFNFSGLASINSKPDSTLGGLENADINKYRISLIKVCNRLQTIDLFHTRLNDVALIDDLIEEIGGTSLSHQELVAALMDTGEAKNRTDAESFVRELLSYGFLHRKLTYKLTDTKSSVSPGDDLVNFLTRDDGEVATFTSSHVHGSLTSQEDVFAEAMDGLLGEVPFDNSESFVDSEDCDFTESKFIGRESLYSSPIAGLRNSLEYLITSIDLAAGLFSDKMIYNSEAKKFASKPGTSTSDSFSLNFQDKFKFSICLAGADNIFRCSSDVSQANWILALRHGVEHSWLKYTLGKNLTSTSSVTLDSFSSTVELKVRADGPTKVVELIETGGDMLPASKPEESESRYIDGDARSGKKGPELNISVVVESISFSVVDKQPSELFYLQLYDIQISAQRKPKVLSLAITVQNIQMDNQLSDPIYKVALYPREIKSETGCISQLMLPGLHQKLEVFPTLHLYIKQRVITEEEEQIADEEARNLLYFDIATIWIAPLELQLDNEIVIRTLRIVNSAINEFTAKATNLSNSKIDIDDEAINEDEFHPSGLLRQTIDLMSFSSSLYSDFDPNLKRSRGIYFSVLQLHPIDLCMSFKTAPLFSPHANEDSVLYAAMQLDKARLCLNALIAENAFGTAAYISSVVIKHYKNSFFKQLYKIIGSADIVEGSVGGLLGNLGTGVYDLFYEPIDGLLGEDGSFFEGLGRGGMSLGSKTIGGVSGFASTVTKGIGSGMSFLTGDSDFYKNRAKGKMKAASSISEGIIVGGKELGNNIVEGITGIVTAPYRGFVEEGASGMAKGFAQGILGVALKPAVGVIDAVSRTAEGIKNATFSNHQRMIGAEEEVSYHSRIRRPRTFSRAGAIVRYDKDAAIVQELVAETFGDAFVILYHQRLSRSAKKGYQEAWGLGSGVEYILLVGKDRFMLVTLTSPSFGKRLRVLWSCHATYISQLFCDENCDLICPTNLPVSLSGSWSDNNCVIVDDDYKDYIALQILLEKTIGVKLSRRQVMRPRGGFYVAKAWKKSEGLKRMLASQTSYAYLLQANVLYEFETHIHTGTINKLKQSIRSSIKVPFNVKSAIGEDSTLTGNNSGDAMNRSDSVDFVSVDASSRLTDPPDDYGPILHAYPLVDLIVTGPVLTDGNKYMISIFDKNGGLMRGMKRCEDTGRLIEYLKPDKSLILVFSDLDTAEIMKNGIEMVCIHGTPEDVVTSKPLAQTRSFSLSNSKPTLSSIINGVVIPTSDLDSVNLGILKNEVTKTLFLSNR